MSLRHAILGVLEFQPLHGYALKCVLEEGIAYFWPVNLPAIYPCLRRLEEEGLVTHHRETTREGRPDRKVYAVTDAGREELARWRREPPESDVPRFRNALFLKLLFAKRENLPDAQHWIAREEEESARREDDLRSKLADSESLPLFVRFLRETGLAHLELHRRCLRDLQRQIAEILERDAWRPDAGGTDPGAGLEKEF
jgi:DNA-binding PadR family transcriptional regulator